MPIVDVTWVEAPTEAETAGALIPAGLAATLADRLGEVFGAAPGRVWVRLHVVPAHRYAENLTPPSDPPPVFVAVMLAQAPQGEARAQQAARLAEAVASACNRPCERVHVEYAADGLGRVAFGGVLVR